MALSNFGNYFIHLGFQASHHLEILIDLQNLKTLSRHNHSFIREILEVYLSNTPKDMQNLRAHVKEEDWPQVRYFAHKLKSSSLSLGFEKGYKLFHEMEDIIKNEGDTSPIPEMTLKAEELCNLAFIQIKVELTNYV